MKIDLGLDLNSVVINAVQKHVEENKAPVVNMIKREVEIAVDALKPTLVKLPELGEIVFKKKTHSNFVDALNIARCEKQLYLYGPAGSGKTTLAADIATALKRDFSHISCSAGMSEGHLLGRMLFDGQYVESEFVRLYENGGVFLFDEIDAADANTLLVVNSALANGHMSVPNRRDNPTAKRHPDFICVVAGNTLGQGDVSYTGRNYMDAAFLDRFALSKVEIKYDNKLEKEICGKNTGIYKTLSDARGRIKQNKLNRVISTRAFVSAVRLLHSGYKEQDIVNKLTLGWSKEEVKKCFPN